MQAFHLCCVCFLLADISVKTEAAGPIWSTSETLSVNASGSGFCDFVAIIYAVPEDESPPSYSIESQIPYGAFYVYSNEDLGRFELRCNEDLIVQEQYVVVARAIQDIGNGEFSDRTITITFSGIPRASNGSGSGSNSNNNNSTGKIVGGVIGGVAGVAVVGLVGFVIYKVFVSSKHPPADKNGK